MNPESTPFASTPPEPQKRLSAGLLTVAVVSSLIASTCCVIPLILVLVGITGAWMVNLTAMRPFALPFTVIALASLVWAGYLIFRPIPCLPESVDCRTARNTTKKIFVACALFIAALLLFPFAAPLFY